MDTDTGLTMIAERVRSATSVAYARGYEPPPEYVEVQRVATEAARVRDEPAPAIPSPPTDPKKVAEWCDELAAARVASGERKSVAAELYERVNRTAMRLVVEAVPGWVVRVCDEFDAAVAEFEHLAVRAPHEVVSSMSPDESAQHLELLRAAEALGQAALARGQLALVNDEGDQIGRGGALWLILDPRDEATLFTVSDALRAFAGRFPSTITEWQSVASIGLRMARPGEVGWRRERFAQLLHFGGMGPDGGMHDKTFAEATEMVASGGGKRVSAARAGQM